MVKINEYIHIWPQTCFDHNTLLEMRCTGSNTKKAQTTKGEFPDITSHSSLGMTFLSHHINYLLVHIIPSLLISFCHTHFPFLPHFLSKPISQYQHLHDYLLVLGSFAVAKTLFFFLRNFVLFHLCIYHPKSNWDFLEWWTSNRKWGWMMVIIMICSCPRDSDSTPPMKSSSLIISRIRFSIRPSPP